MSFLWNPYVMGLATTLLLGSMLWVSVKVAHTKLSGDNLSPKTRLWVRVVVATSLTAVVLNIWNGYEDTVASALAVYMAGLGIIAFVFVYLLIGIISFRRSRMEAAYREYDELRKKGHRPCIVVSSIFGPKVIASYPSTMRVGILMWSDNGRVRCYVTTAQTRLDQAQGLY